MPAPAPAAPGRPLWRSCCHLLLLLMALAVLLPGACLVPQRAAPPAMPPAPWRAAAQHRQQPPQGCCRCLPALSRTRQRQQQRRRLGLCCRPGAPAKPTAAAAGRTQRPGGQPAGTGCRCARPARQSAKVAVVTLHFQVCLPAAAHVHSRQPIDRTCCSMRWWLHSSAVIIWAPCGPAKAAAAPSTLRQQASRARHVAACVAPAGQGGCQRSVLHIVYAQPPHSLLPFNQPSAGPATCLR